MAKKTATKPIGRPCLFLSHSGIDTEAAKALKARILATQAAKDAGLEVWFDKDDLVPGVEDWQRQIETALTQKATAFAVLVGTRGVMNWVEREVRVALSRATGPDPIPFIPILASSALGMDLLPAFAQTHQAVIDPLGRDEQLKQLVAAALRKTPTTTALYDEPFVGLRSMTEADAGRFFGRDEEIQDLVTALRRHRLLAIVADSGAGKSSLAMAGLVPAFRGGAFADTARREPDGRIWNVIIMRPGSDPLEGLRRGVTEAAEKMGLAAGERFNLRKRLDLTDLSEAAFALRCDLPADRTETLLVVDQFDELLTETPDAERGIFVDFLTRLTSIRAAGFRVLLTIRADYFNLCRPFDELYRQLAHASDPATLRLKRISDAGLEDAVRRPIQMAGYQRSDDTERLARRTRMDLGDRAGDLALAQMALYVVWKSRRGPDTTLVEAYADVGGVTGALAQEAERVRTAKLSAEEATSLTPLMVRLVRLGDTGGAVRRICRRDELDGQRRALADRLCSDEYGRLLLAGEDTFEVCHEALITQWPWLQDELNRAAGDLRDFDPLIRRAAQWASVPSQDRSSHIATGAEREIFALLATRRRDWLSETELAFIDASEESYRRDIEIRQKEKRFRQQILRAAIAASIVLAVLGAFAAWSAREANYQQQLAVEAARRADSAADQAREAAQRERDAAAEANAAAHRAIENETIGLSALSRLEVTAGRPVDAIKLALSAWPREGDEGRPMTRRALESLGNAWPYFQQVQQVESKEATNSAWFSPDGRYFAFGDQQVHLWNISLWSEVNAWDGHSARFSRDGSKLIVLDFDNAALIIDLRSGKEIKLVGHDDVIQCADFSPDGQLVATAASDLTARLWDASTGKEIGRLSGLDDALRSIEFSPDGRRVVTASSANGIARIWDIKTNVELFRLAADGFFDAAYSPNGSLIVTGGASDNSAIVWNAVTGAEVRRLIGHSGWVRTVSFSSDGKRVLTSSFDSTARVWDVATGIETTRYVGHSLQVNSAAFSSDGARAITTSDDGTVRFWDAATGSGSLFADRDTQSAAFSPDDWRIATGSIDSDGQILDASTGAEILRLIGHTQYVRSISFSLDGAMVATASQDTTAIVWDATTGASLMQFKGHSSSVNDAEFSPDGKQLVTASDDGTVRIWDVNRGVELQRIANSPTLVRSAAYSPDGTRILSVGFDYAARVYSLTGQELLALGTKDEVPFAGGFLLDGKLIFTAGSTYSPDGGGGFIRLWDADTGNLLRGISWPGEPAFDASFTADAARVVTSSLEHAPRIWDVATGAEIGRLPTKAESRTWSVSFSHDGKRVVTSSDEGTRIWNVSSLPSGNALQMACTRLGENTSLNEVRKRYGLTDLVPICSKGHQPLAPDSHALQ